MKNLLSKLLILLLLTASTLHLFSQQQHTVVEEEYINVYMYGNTIEINYSSYNAQGYAKLYSLNGQLFDSIQIQQRTTQFVVNVPTDLYMLDVEISGTEYFERIYIENQASLTVSSENNVITIETDSLWSGNCEIVSPWGETVYNGAITSKITEIVVNSASGNYIVTVELNGNSSRTTAYIFNTVAINISNMDNVIIVQAPNAKYGYIKVFEENGDLLAEKQITYDTMTLSLDTLKGTFAIEVSVNDNEQRRIITIGSTSIEKETSFATVYSYKNAIYAINKGQKVLECSIYSLSGAFVKQFQAEGGTSNSVSVPKGMYIVKYTVAGKEESTVLYVE